jgi:PAS domain S-box-containing protein
MDFLSDQADEISRIREILKKHPKGLTIEEIAKTLPLNRTSTAKYLNTLLISGQAEMMNFGRAKVFSLSQRVPFSQMLNLSSDLLLVLNHELLIIQVNEPFIKVFGTPRDALLGVKFDESPLMAFFSEDNLNRIHAAVNGSESTKMDRITIKSETYYFRLKFIPCVFDQGDKGLTIILEDLTELKKHQEKLEQLVDDRTVELKKVNEQLLNEIREREKSSKALEQSERRCRELIENANSIILRTDTNGLITFFSKFAESFFGINEANVLGKNIMGTIILAPPHNIKAPIQLSRDFLKPARHMMFKETQVERNDGTKAWVAWTVKEMIDTQTNVREFLLLGTDITELQIYIERSQKLLETHQIEIDAKSEQLQKLSRQ